MADEFRGKSNEQIINENAASLEAKSHYQNSASFNPAGETTTAMDSGVNESGVEGFPTTRGIEQVGEASSRRRRKSLDRAPIAACGNERSTAFREDAAEGGGLGGRKKTLASNVLFVHPPGT
ncbi:hypothetical protein IEO21_09044 [Rhodonia placenta]|uniref:Uncharacterized protein n=1 Tax=Rhodonia placenta TaxID=104341 RepID=A0A8H7NV41_9APHY|nr:hypothetical protein IEO21_09044 [Postia placenta]